MTRTTDFWRQSLGNRIIRGSALTIGTILLLFGVGEQLVPRASFVSANPTPGAALASPPASVAVNFNDKLAEDSEMSVSSTITLSPLGEPVYGNGPVFKTKGPDSHDPEQRTLRADLDPKLPHGLYWVNWTTVAAYGRAKSSGRFCYAVGITVPGSITREHAGGFYERDYRWRSDRAALLGGIFMVLIAVFSPRFLQRVR
jgi:methionine-rich copper-binding protein CopC